MAVTIQDIATAAKVSQSTVSRALANSPRVKLETRKLIQQLAREMGYTPSAIARGLATKRTHTLGVVVWDIADAFVAELVRAIDRAALESGYSLVLSHCGDDPQRQLSAVNILRQQRVDGIIVPDSSAADFFLPLVTEGDVPVILINHRAYRYSVGTDNESAARMAVDYLAHLGHQRIAYIGGMRYRVESEERKAGYRQALAAGGLPLDVSLSVDGEGGAEGGQKGMKQLLTLPQPPTAVFCFNDLTAIGAIGAIQASGRRVPDDISVMGFDDITLNPYLHPSLTSVAQQKEQIAHMALAMVLRLLEHESVPVGQFLAGNLMPRDSTAPCARPV